MKRKVLHGVNTPIDPSITFAFERAEDPSRSFSGKLSRGLYARFGHPNFDDLITCLCKMEGGESAALFATGIAATFALFWDKCGIGDHVVVSSRIYGGTRGQIQMLKDKLQLNVSVVDVTDLDAVRKACTSETKILFTEVMSNPELVVADIRALADICHEGENDILLAVDNTFSPLMARPLKDGADVVMHSLTKYVDGESDAMGGALVASMKFIDDMTHPRDGVASLTGAVMHYSVAQMMAVRFNYLEYRVRESSKKAFALARLFARAGLNVRYPLLAPRPGKVLAHHGEEMGGGVFSVEFSNEHNAAMFVNRAIKAELDEPLLPNVRLAHSCVSLGSAHSYAWLTIEANAQAKGPRWNALPFSPVPPGYVRFAMGYAGDLELCLTTYKRLLAESGYLLRPEAEIIHT